MKKEDLKGGLAKGPSHAEGGIPLVVEDTGQHIEIEGDEFVFDGEVLNKTEVLELEGTPWEIIKQIAKKYGNNTGKLEGVDGNDFIICKKVMYDTEKMKVGGTPKQIINELQLDKGCRVSADSETLKNGGGLKSMGCCCYMDPFYTFFHTHLF